LQLAEGGLNPKPRIITIAGEDPEFGHGPSKKFINARCQTAQFRPAKYQRQHRRFMMPEEHRKSDETLEVLIKSRWAVIRVEGGGGHIAWGALGCLTALGALFLCLLFLP
jgi:hypothetical protein